VAVAVVARRRVRVGPALRVAPIPFGSLTLSAVLHLGLIAAAVVAITTMKEHEPKTYIVNLVPSVAAIGRPEGRVSRPTPPPPRQVESTPPAPPAPPTAKVPDLPARELPRPAPAPPLPPREMPAREMPSRPGRDAVAMPERSLPARTTTAPLPRLEQKELPSVASTTTRSLPPAATPPPASTTTGTAPPQPAAPPPPVTRGQPTGSPQGTGAVTLDVDFPYAWYLSRVHAKISERWQDKALPGQQPIAIFKIHRDGQISDLAIKTTSGNPLYDRAAMRAIADAAPFPKLPDDFKEPWLRIHLGFSYSPERG
jgi:protein TonB